MVYLFDFDGTLVDSMPTYGQIMLDILNENNIEYPSDIIKIITPLGFRKTAEHFIKMGVNKTVDQLINCMNERAIDAYTNYIPAKNNVIEVLKKLHARGDSLNVLTASPHITLDPCLKRLGIFDLFDNVWSCDDFSTSKADPEIYVKAAKKMGVSVEQVVFLDDNHNADKTAKSAGMTVYGVFDKSSEEFVEEMKELTDKYIYDFIELL